MKRKKIVALGCVVLLLLPAVLCVGGWGWFLSGVYPPPSQPTDGLAITGGRVFTIEGWVDGDVVVDGDRITCVGDCTVPGGAVIVDATGSDVVPGLIDLHAHLGAPLTDSAGELKPMGMLELLQGRPDMRQAYLRHGVTTLRPLCDHDEMAAMSAHRIEAQEWAGPRVFSAGPCFTAPGGHPTDKMPPRLIPNGVRLPETEKEARDQVRQLKDMGFQGVKAIYTVGGNGTLPRLDGDVLVAILDEARRNDMWTAVHTDHDDEVIAAAEAGADTIEHGALTPFSDAAIEAMRRADATLVPTLAVVEANLPARYLEIYKDNVRVAHAAGVRIGVGSDTQRAMRFGEGTIREIELLESCGFSREDLLHMATHEAADLIGDAALGRLQAGSPADVVVLEAGGWQARTVVSHGRLYRW